MEFKDIINMIQDFSNQKTEYKKLFFSNALAGEVGEFCNLIKKLHRDCHTWFPIDYIKYRDKLKQELADIFIYLVLNAKVNHFDLELAILDKIKIIEKRLNK